MNKILSVLRAHPRLTIAIAAAAVIVAALVVLGRWFLKRRAAKKAAAAAAKDQKPSAAPPKGPIDESIIETLAAATQQAAKLEAANNRIHQWLLRLGVIVYVLSAIPGGWHPVFWKINWVSAIVALASTIRIVFGDEVIPTKKEAKTLKLFLERVVTLGIQFIAGILKPEEFDEAYNASLKALARDGIIIKPLSDKEKSALRAANKGYLFKRLERYFGQDFSFDLYLHGRLNNQIEFFSGRVAALKVAIHRVKITRIILAVLSGSLAYFNLVVAIPLVMFLASQWGKKQEQEDVLKVFNTSLEDLKIILRQHRGGKFKEVWEMVVYVEDILLRDQKAWMASIRYENPSASAPTKSPANDTTPTVPAAAKAAAGGEEK